MADQSQPQTQTQSGGVFTSDQMELFMELGRQFEQMNKEAEESSGEEWPPDDPRLGRNQSETPERVFESQEYPQLETDDGDGDREEKSE